MRSRPIPIPIPNLLLYFLNVLLGNCKQYRNSVVSQLLRTNVTPKLVRNYCALRLLYSLSTDSQIESTSVSSYEDDVVAKGSAGGKQSWEDVAFVANGKSGLQIAVSAP